MRRLPILLLLAVLLAGCGQKGPLYQRQRGRGRALRSA